MSYSSVMVRQTELIEHPSAVKQKSNVGRDIGIAFGVVIGCLIIIGVAGWCWLNRREILSRSAKTERSSLKAES